MRWHRQAGVGVGEGGDLSPLLDLGECIRSDWGEEVVGALLDGFAASDELRGIRKDDCKRRFEVWRLGLPEARFGRVFSHRHDGDKRSISFWRRAETGEVDGFVVGS